MDGSRFDAWTRRRFGRAVGGAAVALLGGGALGATGAEGKARCRKVSRPCSAQAPCCGSLTCGRSALREGKFCCRKPQSACQDSKDCCAPALCTDKRCQVVDMAQAR